MFFSTLSFKSGEKEMCNWCDKTDLEIPSVYALDLLKLSSDFDKSFFYLWNQALPKWLHYVKEYNTIETKVQ